MKKVLVTGGLGYIGSVIVQKLIERSDIELVRVIDNRQVKTLPFSEISKCEFVTGDIRSDTDLNKSLKDVDTVFHLAAVVGDSACDKAPEKAFEINVNCTKKLVNVALKNDVNKVILSSTCSVYGFQNGDEFATEDSIPKPVSLYAKTKLDAEHLLLNVHRKTGLDISILRLGTVYGASLPSSMQFKIFVNIFVQNACINNQIKLFGGDSWRPLVYVGDVARAFLLAGDAPVGVASGEIFNLGSNTENYTIGHVAKLVAEEIPGTEVTITLSPASPSSYKVRFDKIENVLKFSPTYNLRKGVRELRDLITNGYYDQTMKKQ